MSVNKRNPPEKQKEIKYEMSDSRLKAIELAEKFKNIKVTKYDLK